MKLSLALLSATLTCAHAATSISEVSATSHFGMDLLSKARKLEGNQDEDDQTWIADMSLKFMGCHHISQWNPDADGADDVRIESKRLAKFRLCPTNTCNSKSTKGCAKGYGDYIVDMDDFLASYLQNKEEVQEQECEDYLANYCNCDNADDADACAQNCYKNKGMTDCYEANDDDQGQGQQFELNNYLECAQYEPSNDGRRRMEENGDDQDMEYYLGTYCSSQGGSVVLGMFTDDACTNFADSNMGRSTYYQYEGTALPYSDSSIVDTACYSCEEPVEENDYGYAEEEAEPKQVCTDVYEVSGKCETQLSDYNSNANTNACSYLKGIETVSASGVINSGSAAGNKVASAFIGMFAVSFVLLGSYTYYLKTKLDRGRINLSD